MTWRSTTPVSQLCLLAGTGAVSLALEAAPFEPPGPSSRKTPFVITEIMYNPPVIETVGNGVTNRLSTEFIELYNSNPFFEELSGYRISGDIEFTFPPNTKLEGLSYLVLAKNPAELQSVYPLAGVQLLGYGVEDYRTNVVAGVTNVTTNIVNSLSRDGTLRLHNNSGGVVLEIPFSNDHPWPAGADGTGHSLVLARPSYGEADPKAWGLSDRVGGSPGQAEAYTPDPLLGVRINEFLAHTDLPLLDYVELCNHSAWPVDISGCILTDDAGTNKFVVPAFTTMEAGGLISFTETQLGFRLDAAGETIYFWNPDRTRLLDAVQFEAQENGVAMGRSPDGAAEFHRLQTRTPGTNNSPILVHDLVINEIMYEPISRNSDDAYVELFNQGSSAISLAGWRLERGIDFTFPAHALIPPRGYVVVAKNAAHLIAKYPGTLTPTNTFGNYSGNLAGRGERLALSFLDSIVATNAQQKVETNLIHVIVDEVTYGTGGNWGKWSHGGGSSLELRDPRANHRLAFNWTDSDETAKAPWTAIEVTGPMDNGAESPDNLQAYLMGEGECLLDNVECFVAPSGPNLVATPTFESGIGQWIGRGDHIRSTLANTGYNSARSLHVRASDRGDSMINRLRVPLNSALPTGSSAIVTIRAKVRWLRGWPEVLLRTHGNYLDLVGRMTLPLNLGTPGAANSCAVTNAPPAIQEVSHAPVVPGAWEPVVVTARADDPDKLAEIRLNYRLDPDSNYASLAMRDDGLEGDAMAGDGVFSAMIPGQPPETLAAFQISATDTRGASSRFPIQDPTYTRPFEGLIRFGDPVLGGGFGTYRQWFTADNISDWINRPVMSNERIFGTFVYGDCRVVYGMSSKYSGSPYHQSFSSPVTSSCHYSLEMPRDDRVLGTDNFNKIHAPGNSPFADASLQREQICYWFARTMGLPWNYRRYVHMVVNGNRRGGSNAMMEDTQVPGGDLLDEFFPGETDGHLFKLQPWFEGDDTMVGSITFRNRAWCTLLRFTTVNNGVTALDRTRYRNNFLVRSVETTADDYQPVVNLINAANTPAAQGLTESMDAIVDVEQWFRTFAVEHASGNWDSFGARNAQNMYAYQPRGGRMQLMMWDVNIVLDGSSWAPGAELFTVTSGQSGPQDTVMQSFYSHPPFRRAYLRALKELCNKGFVATNVNPVLDAKYAAFLANGISATSPAATKSWIAQARANILATIAAEDSVSLVLSGSPSFSSSSNSVVLSGLAPVQVKAIHVNGQIYPVTWATVRDWRIRVALEPGVNVFNLQGLDLNGQPLAGLATTATVNYLGPVLDDASGNAVVNEIQFAPSVANAAFVEIFNRSATTAFDLTGWRVNGLNYTFPGAVIGPSQYLVLTKDRSAFATAYGGAAFDQFDGVLDPDGETLTLVKPGPAPDAEIIVDRVRFEPASPWVGATNGASLQLVDAAQDNSRVANWQSWPPVTNVTSVSPQWINVTRTGTIPANSSGFYLYLQTAGEIYVDDVVLVAGTVAGNGVNLLSNGNFESSLADTWLLSSDFTNSTLSTSVKHSGNSSLRLVATAGGSGSGDAVIHSISPALTNGSTYTLSFWYLQNSNGSPFVARLSNSSASAGVYASFDPRAAQGATTILSGATPGRINRMVTNLPAFPPIWLNELLADNITSLLDNIGEHDPWVELHNSGPEPIPLDNCYLSDSYSNLARWPFPAGATIPAGGFLVVWCDGQPEQTSSGSLHASFRLPSGHGSLALSRLLNGSHQILDYLNYTNLPANWSYGDFPDGQPFYRSAMFAATPGTSNTNTSPPLIVFINEWMTDNNSFLADAADQQFEDWFELFNPGDAPVDLGGYFLTDNLNDKFQFRVPDNGHYRIPSRGYLLVWADNDPGQNSTNLADLHVNFALNKDGEEIGLFAADGTMIDAVVSGPQAENASEGRFPDGSATINPLPKPTPRNANVVANSAPTLAAISDRVVTLGQTLTFNVFATDADQPPQSLNFSLADAPSEASIHPTTGRFSWTPLSAPVTSAIKVIVSDSGEPSLTATQTFVVVVVQPPALESAQVSAGQFSFSWMTLPGQKFQLEHTSDLEDTAWQPVGEPLTGTGGPLGFAISADEAERKFYRLRILP